MSASRRKFLQQLSSTALFYGAGSLERLQAEERYDTRMLQYERKYTANDAIRVAVVGTGIMGHNDLASALKVPGVSLAGACDLYKGRLTRMKELYGKDLFVTQDYRELLLRKDIDAIIIATSDYHHARISTDALKAGKHVYCEKPMVHQLSQGLGVINTWKASGKTMQVGSQGISGLDFAKARELYRSGAIGQLNCIEAFTDRQSALGAWQYTLPTDASAATVDWDKYIAGMPKQAFDPMKFFRWRNYKEFGTGMSGDLFVHLLTGIHFITGSHGPSKIMANGQLVYWKDGRNVPDVLTAILEYPSTDQHPSFQVMLRVNFISGAGDKGSTRLVGSDGVMELGWDGLTVHNSLMPKAPGIGGWDSLETYPKAMQEELLKAYDQKYSAADKASPTKEPIQFKTPEGFNEHVEHFANFFNGVRTGAKVIEDPIVGFRACAPCLAVNDSIFQKKIIYWDAEKMMTRV
ncbi:MAG: Gfo/Idh/MocA family oxidoreductase [Chitinophagaceae bacterium]|uniref:Gfo/Idh/MocA family oxidoreductase n=1 Tax=unclassified Paraflavitalea TaxID=2798305 RepID=UPI003D32CB92|nr:Gfo/Idh/MocA family oxidoreductase [Chitinophagaceae bacterium]